MSVKFLPNDPNSIKLQLIKYQDMTSLAGSRLYLHILSSAVWLFSPIFRT